MCVPSAELNISVIVPISLGVAAPVVAVMIPAPLVDVDDTAQEGPVPPPEVKVQVGEVSPAAIQWGNVRAPEKPRLPLTERLPVMFNDDGNWNMSLPSLLKHRSALLAAFLQQMSSPEARRNTPERAGFVDAVEKRLLIIPTLEVGVLVPEKVTACVNEVVVLKVAGLEKVVGPLNATVEVNVLGPAMKPEGKLIEPLNVGEPVKFGFPEKFPVSDPPALTATAPLNVEVPAKVWLPVQALLPARNGGGVM